MKIGLLGFNGCGKTTVFNALSGSHSAMAPYAAGRTQPHVAVVKVPDKRLDELAALLKPSKIVHATVEYVDVAGIERTQLGKGKGLGEEQLQVLAQNDALLAVIRAFEGGGVPVDMAGDLEAIELEMVLSDLAKLEARLPKLEKMILKVSGKELEQAQHELSALSKIKPVLEQGIPIRSAPLSPDEEKTIRGFMFLTQKPILFLLNIGEDILSRGEDPLTRFPLPGGQKDRHFAAMCAEIEAEIAQLSPAERGEFLKDYHIEEPAAFRIIRLCYDILGYISFFTTNEKELRAWTIKKGTPAARAAGGIHTDMERGFIRAEKVSWEKFLKAGGFSHARKTADLEIHGKDYIVQDGDVIHFLFSV
jgi:hypothetical protein